MVLNQNGNKVVYQIVYLICSLFLGMGEKHSWTDEQIKCLLETAIHEISTFGKKGLSLHKDSWTRVGSVLKEKFGISVDQRQMKNCYDTQKAKYTGWVYLKNKTGNLYNPQTNMFNLTNEEWVDFKKVCLQRIIGSLCLTLVNNLKLIYCICFRGIQKLGYCKQNHCLIRNFI